MELSITLYDWLLSISGLTEYEVKEKTTESIILDQNSTQMFEAGLKFLLLLHRLKTFKVLYSLIQNINNPNNSNTLPEFNGLKNSMTPAAKLYNWNLIIDVLKTFEINVEEDVKNLIIGGDLQFIVELLEQIKKKEEELSIMLKRKNKKETYKIASPKASKGITESICNKIQREDTKVILTNVQKEDIKIEIKKEDNKIISSKPPKGDAKTSPNKSIKNTPRNPKISERSNKRKKSINEQDNVEKGKYILQ